MQGPRFGSFLRVVPRVQPSSWSWGINVLFRLVDWSWGRNVLFRLVDCWALAPPPKNRVGDYVHCLSRVLNVTMKRLLAECDPRAAGPLKEILHHVSLESQGLPMPERLAPRMTKLGNLDLTAATLFIGNFAMHGRIGQFARSLNKRIPFRNGQLNMGSAIELLFRRLHSIHKFWRQPQLLTQEEKNNYRALVTDFGEIWQALGWKVSTWVHWTVRHSSAQIDLHDNIYIFSSIPTERRNVEFKMDVSHCFKGWKLSRPYASKFGFGHVLCLAALDCGIALYLSRRKGQKRAVPSESDDEE